ncbi:MAG TPA: helix-turn-helix transcriptional regulator [Polyangiaceae bacterium]|nr:helix-turn-helix transcriptional regulator [Polyangiaceae bacterium]
MPKRSAESAFLRSIAHRIGAARRAAGMTQEQLAAELDTAVRNVQRIESGVQNLTLLTIARIAAAIGLTPYELLNGRR